MLILIIAQLDTTLDFFLYLLGYSVTQVLVTWSLLFLCVIAVKVDVCACEDEVKVNYSHWILSQREP